MRGKNGELLNFFLIAQSSELALISEFYLRDKKIMGRRFDGGRLRIGEVNQYNG